MRDIIKKYIQESIDTKQKLLSSKEIEVIERIAHTIIGAYHSGKKMVVFGNGGSASDAQHFAAELVCRFQKNRPALSALALTTDTAILTAAGNDFGYNEIFSRQIEAHVHAHDIVIGITTSGKSTNVLKALETARKKKAVTIAFCGNYTDALKENTDIFFSVPSNVTARIQECHILAIHIICALLEETLFEEK